jgi:N6-adenosine-specific RNA methylase IME4
MKTLFDQSIRREQSRKPDEQYDLIEACSPRSRIGLFPSGPRKEWFDWVNQAEEYLPDWYTYSNHSQSSVVPFQKIAKGF